MTAAVIIRCVTSFYSVSSFNLMFVKNSLGTLCSDSPLQQLSPGKKKINMFIMSINSMMKHDSNNGISDYLLIRLESSGDNLIIDNLLIMSHSFFCLSQTNPVNTIETIRNQIQEVIRLTPSERLLPSFI